MDSWELLHVLRYLCHRPKTFFGPDNTLAVGVQHIKGRAWGRGGTARAELLAFQSWLAERTRARDGLAGHRSWDASVSTLFPDDTRAFAALPVLFEEFLAQYTLSPQELRPAYPVDQWQMVDLIRHRCRHRRFYFTDRSFRTGFHFIYGFACGRGGRERAELGAFRHWLAGKAYKRKDPPDSYALEWYVKRLYPREKDAIKALPALYEEFLAQHDPDEIEPPPPIPVPDWVRNNSQR